MSSLPSDQASGLRKLFGGRPLRVISFVAASEGVGKTHVVANLAVAMAERGRKVLVLDENSGQDNVAGLLGGHQGNDLLDAIWGRQAIESVLSQPIPGVWICPAAKAFRQIGGFGAAEQKFLLETLGGLPTPPDTILIDAAHDHPLGFSPVGLVAQETVVVLSGQTHAITGAYALIKAVASAFGRRNFSVLVNKVRTAAEAEKIFGNLSRVAVQRGVAEIEFAGVLPQDEAVAHDDYSPVGG